jgi:hypothetical protein
VTLIPHSRLAAWIGRQPDIDRCRLRFSESIYGARPYNQPWLVPFTGRIIFLADSFRLSGRVVGLDKIDHSNGNDTRRLSSLSVPYATRRAPTHRRAQ